MISAIVGLSILVITLVYYIIVSREGFTSGSLGAAAPKTGSTVPAAPASTVPAPPIKPVIVVPAVPAPSSTIIRYMSPPGWGPVVVPATASTTGSASTTPSPSGSEMMDKIRPYLLKELKDDIELDVRRLIKKEGVSPSEMQGSEFKKSNQPSDIEACPGKCPDVCDNDDYIRKDSIPCWSCNLPRGT